MGSSSSYGLSAKIFLQQRCQQKSEGKQHLGFLLTKGGVICQQQEKHRPQATLSEIGRENAKYSCSGQVEGIDEAASGPSAPSRPAKAQVAKIASRIQTRHHPPHLPRTVDFVVFGRKKRQHAAEEPKRDARAKERRAANPSAHAKAPKRRPLWASADKGRAELRRFG